MSLLRPGVIKQPKPKPKPLLKPFVITQHKLKLKLEQLLNLILKVFLDILSELYLGYIFS